MGKFLPGYFTHLLARCKKEKMTAMKREWSIPQENELRCEVKEDEWLTIRLLNGTAEIFGVELAPNKEYTFHDQNFAVFTWYGCTVETSGTVASSPYVADSTPMVAYVNTHIQLEARRDVALANSDSGPRVMIVGGTDQGKSTFSQILTAYAVRLDRNPIFIDLDVGQSSISIPGTISAVPLDKSCLSVEEGFANYTPLVYFFGHNSPKDNVDLYKLMVTTLSQQINKRLDKDVDAKSSGIIVNTSGWIDGAGFDVLLHCIKELAIDVVLVMNNDKLFSTLNNSFEGGAAPSSSSSLKPIVVKLPSSGGVVQRDPSVRKRFRKSKIREYFYGKPQLNNTIVFSPERKENLLLSSFTFLRMGGIQLTEGMKVIERSAHQDACKLSKIVPTSELVYSVVAVLHPLETDQYSSTSALKSGEISQQLIECNVAGFISIVQIDVENDRMTILSPCPGALPGYHLLVGSIKWVE